MILGEKRDCNWCCETFVGGANLRIIRMPRTVDGTGPMTLEIQEKSARTARTKIRCPSQKAHQAAGTDSDGDSRGHPDRALGELSAANCRRQGFRSLATKCKPQAFRLYVHPV